MAKQKTILTTPGKANSSKKSAGKKKGTSGKAGSGNIAGGSGVVRVCENRSARRNYEIGERFEAGIMLAGTEVKSCRAGQAHLNDAYVDIKNGEAFLVNAHIGEYSHGNVFNHLPNRTRKLLLHDGELHKLSVRYNERGFSIVPLAMYFKGGWLKVDIALGKGKTHRDKRDTIKDRDINREMQRALRRG